MFGSCGPVPEELLREKGNSRAYMTKEALGEVPKGLAYTEQLEAAGCSLSEAETHGHTCMTTLSQGSFRLAICQAGMLGSDRCHTHSRRNHLPG